MRTRRTGPLLAHKIKARNPLRSLLRRLRRSGRTVVFTNGCFDILHYGHVRYLERAARLGDCLVVAVNSDSSVRRLKGASRPVNPQSDRAAVVAALESVDYVTIFPEDTPEELIAFLEPDILVKGSDWDKKTIAGAAGVLARRGRVVTVPLEQGRSTSALIERIRRFYR